MIKKRTRSKSKSKEKVPRPKKAPKSKKAPADSPFYTLGKDLDPSIAKYCTTTVARTAKFENKMYFYVTSYGKPVYCGGLHKMLKKYFYPEYNPKKKVVSKKTNMKASSSQHGKTIDKQLLRLLGGLEVKRKSAETKAIIDYFASIGHIGQAAQLPVEIPRALKLTQADYITKCKETGELFLWELKTGGKNLEHEVPSVYFNNIKGNVPCTQMNIWQIQLHFTRKSLEKAGVPIRQARVIQVGKHQFKDEVQIKIHTQPEWLKDIELNHIFQK